MAMKIKCRFNNSSNWTQRNVIVYTCIVEDCNIPENIEINFWGAHNLGHDNNHVRGIAFNNCKMNKIPKGLTKSFPILKYLSVNNTKLESIEKEDLEDLSQLTEFRMDYCDIKFLPGDLFENMKKFQVISFNFNPLIYIDPVVLEGLTNLKYVGFYQCYSIDLCWDSINTTGNSSLKNIKTELRDKFSNPSFKLLIQQINEKEIKIQEKNQELQSIVDRTDEGIFGDVKKYLMMEDTKDFMITIEDNKEFKVHKFLFVARSPTFAEMIKNNPDAEVLNIKDISDEIFEKILDFIYTDRLPDGNFKEIFLAAEKLKIESLRDFAVEKLVDGINGENAFEHLVLGNKFQNDEVKQKSFEEIQKLFPDYEFDDELMDEPEKLKIIIELKQKLESEMKSLSIKLKK